MSLLGATGGQLEELLSPAAATTAAEQKDNSHLKSHSYAANNHFQLASGMSLDSREKAKCLERALEPGIKPATTVKMQAENKNGMFFFCGREAFHFVSCCTALGAILLKSERSQFLK